jgi:hypothetical protein
MADTKISALTLDTSLIGTEELPFALAGANGKTTVDAIHNNIRLDTAAGVPAAPSAGKTAIFARNVGGRILPAFKGPSGLDSSLQPHLGRNRFSYWQPLGNSTTVPLTTGFAAATALGTATARNVAVTNVLTRMKRLGYVSAATAGAFSGIYWNAAASTQITVGSGAGNDASGFHAVTRFGVSDAAAVAGARMFVGFQTGVAAPTNVEPNTLTNCIGVAQLSTDNTQFYLVYGGSAAQTAIPLGTAVGAPTLTDTAFDLSLFSSQYSSTSIGYTFTNLKTGVEVSGTISGVAGTAIPSSSTYGMIRAWRCNNATLLAVGLDIGSITVETDA